MGSSSAGEKGRLPFVSTLIDSGRQMKTRHRVRELDAIEV
jgi:hypothetical protein